MLGTPQRLPRKKDPQHLSADEFCEVLGRLPFPGVEHVVWWKVEMFMSKDEDNPHVLVRVAVDPLVLQATGLNVLKLRFFVRDKIKDLKDLNAVPDLPFRVVVKKEVKQVLGTIVVGLSDEDE